MSAYRGDCVAKVGRPRLQSFVLSYGGSFTDSYRLAGVYAGRIMRTLVVHRTETNVFENSRSNACLPVIQNVQCSKG